MGLCVLSLPILAFFLWLKLARGISFVGPVPALAFWLLPMCAGQWLVLWERRGEAWMRLVLIVFPLVTLASILLIMVGRSLDHH